jgi:hypothetical protein
MLKGALLVVGPQYIDAVVAATASFSANITDPRTGLLTTFGTAPQSVSPELEYICRHQQVIANSNPSYSVRQRHCINSALL